MRALFVGLCTLDVITLVDHVPAPNEKLTARTQTVAAGGPATGAAATFAHLGGEAVLLTAFGGHPLAGAIDADLAALGVDVINLTADSPEPPAVSTILVTAATGDRAVASTNAASGASVSPPGDLSVLVGDADVVLVDAHHLATHITTRLTPPSFDAALAFAATVASRTCGSFGTREWMRA